MRDFLTETDTKVIYAPFEGEKIWGILHEKNIQISYLHKFSRIKIDISCCYSYKVSDVMDKKIIAFRLQNTFCLLKLVQYKLETFSFKFPSLNNVCIIYANHVTYRLTFGGVSNINVFFFFEY